MIFSEVIIVLLFLLLLAGFFYMIFFSMYKGENVSAGFLSFAMPLKPGHRKILETKFPYYRQLGFNNKRKFEIRLRYFLANKTFYGREDLEVTEEMKLLIGAAAVQVTFGFEAVQLRHFRKIILYPKAYYSRHTQKKHKGEVNTAGAIVFSWEDFLKGYHVPDDGFNVGLHEMAHALKMEDLIPNGEYSFLDEQVLKRWQEVARKEIKKVQTGENKFLRSYAGTNAEEFFAVCVEQFFEQPGEFRRQLPLVYQTLAELLQQDPLELRIDG